MLRNLIRLCVLPLASTGQTQELDKAEEGIVETIQCFAQCAAVMQDGSAILANRYHEFLVLLTALDSKDSTDSESETETTNDLIVWADRFACCSVAQTVAQAAET